MFVDHPVLLHHFNWLPATTGTLCITQSLIKRYLFLLPAAMKAKLENFYFFRATIKLRFVVQGAPQAAGMLAFSAYPASKAGISNTNTAVTLHDTLANSRVVPHVLIDPSKSESIELELPICTTTGFYTIDAAASTSLCGSWELDRRVINPLASGTATAPSVNVCVYMSLVDPKFVGLRDTIGLSPLRSEKTAGGALSSIAAGVSKVSRFAAQTFPSLGPELTIFSDVSAGVGSVLQWLGFSKPQSLENGNFITNRSADNYSQIDGMSTALVLGRSQGQTISISPEYIPGGLLEDMSIDHLISIPAIFNQFTILPALGPQAYIGSIPVRPTMSDQLAMTPLAGVALMHQLWRGDLTFTFEFIASVFHRATVLIAWRPTFSATAPTFAEALTVYKNTTVYISGNTSVSITVPYQQLYPMLPTDQSLSYSANGNFFLFIINPVISNGSTDGIACNVLQHSDNCKFALPTLDGIALATPKFVVYNENSFDFTPAAYTVPLAPPRDWVPPTPVAFGSKTNVTNLGSALTGDITVSIKDLISRMSPSMLIGTQSTNNNLSVRPFPMVTGNKLPTFLGYLFPSYTGSRGSVRVSLVGAAGNTFAAYYNPDPLGLFTMTEWTTGALASTVQADYATSLSNCRIAAAGDYAVPMTIANNFYPGRNCGLAGSGLPGSTLGYTGAVTFAGLPTLAAGSYVVMKGAGDDFVMGGFIGFPSRA